MRVVELVATMGRGRDDVVMPSAEDDDSDTLSSSSSVSDATSCVRDEGFLPGRRSLGALASATTTVAARWEAFDRLSQLDHRFLDSDCGNMIIASSSGVRMLAEPSDEEEEPGLKGGRRRGEGSVITWVFGALSRNVDRDLGTWCA